MQSVYFLRGLFGKSLFGCTVHDEKLCVSVSDFNAIVFG